MAENQRFKDMFLYLRENKRVRNQQDFTERISSDKTTVSRIMNGHITIPNNLFVNISNAFPYINVDWLRTGEGEMLRAGYTQNVTESENFTQTGNVTVHGDSAALLKVLDELSAQRKLTEKAQEQIDRLISIIEKH